jgi:hypothetical protein
VRCADPTISAPDARGGLCSPDAPAETAPQAVLLHDTNSPSSTVAANAELHPLPDQAVRVNVYVFPIVSSDVPNEYDVPVIGPGLVRSAPRPEFVILIVERWGRTESAAGAVQLSVIPFVALHVNVSGAVSRPAVSVGVGPVGPASGGRGVGAEDHRRPEHDDGPGCAHRRAERSTREGGAADEADPNDFVRRSRAGRFDDNDPNIVVSRPVGSGRPLAVPGLVVPVPDRCAGRSGGPIKGWWRSPSWWRWPTARARRPGPSSGAPPRRTDTRAWPLRTSGRWRVPGRC